MSKIYWMSQIIASNSSEYIGFLPASSNLISTTVGSAIREVATTVTGIKMSKEIAQGATIFSFTNINFTENMYVEYYCNKDIELQTVPTYDDLLKTLTFTCKAVKEECVFKIVVKF